MSNPVVKEIDGRKWSRGDDDRATRTFKILAGTAANESFTYTGIPAKGDAHPHLAGLYAATISFEEGTGAEKGVVKCTVEYARRTNETSGSGEAAVAYSVEDWGWDAATEEKELTTASDGTAILNSAGDTFESVPQVSVHAPVFTKVVKFKQRQSGAMAYSCKVNASATTIGGQSYPAGSLLCTVSEKRLLGDAEWKYRYVVTLKYKSNPVRLAGAQTLTDIGWDVAITDAGMREIVDGKLKLIRQTDPETGKQCTVTSPELLDGSGRKVVRTSGSTPTPYNIRFKAYAEATFPDWFYSEPN